MNSTVYSSTWPVTTESGTAVKGTSKQGATCSCVYTTPTAVPTSGEWLDFCLRLTHYVNAVQACVWEFNTLVLIYSWCRVSRVPDTRKPKKDKDLFWAPPGHGSVCGRRFRCHLMGDLGINHSHMIIKIRSSRLVYRSRDIFIYVIIITYM